MPADQYGRSLRGLSINLLVRDIPRALAFAREVLGVEPVYSDPDFAVLRHGRRSGCSTPTTPIATIRCTPASRPTTRGASGRRSGCTTPTPTRPKRRPGRGETRSSPKAMDKPHGVREVFILDPDGYLWAIDHPLSAGAS